MPILHIQIQGQHRAPDGTVTQLSPVVSLASVGPRVQGSVTIEENAGKGLLAQGKSIPVPRNGHILIDTGASHTCVDAQIAIDLGLPVIDTGKMTSATHPDEPCNIYPIKIVLPTLQLNVPKAMGAKLASQGLIALIGRDVLAGGTLFYNGMAGTVTFSLG